MDTEQELLETLEEEQREGKKRDGAEEYIFIYCTEGKGKIYVE